jgi:hypothetical protein
LIFRSPIVPSVPAPDSTTPIAAGPRSAARLRKNASIDCRGALPADGKSRKTPCSIATFEPGGVT